MKCIKTTWYWPVFLPFFLSMPFIHAQADEATDVYYSGNIQAICEKADPQKETLVESKAYCNVYSKNCIRNQAVCIDGMPVNAFGSAAWKKIYQKNVSSFLQNQKKVCQDFPWTCPNNKEKLESLSQLADDYTIDNTKDISKITKHLPKNSVICESDEECGENELCVQNDYGKTGTIKICKSTNNVTCHYNANCPNDQICHKGKCVECIDGSKKVIRLGMVCNRGKWVPDPNHSKMPAYGGCPDGFGMMRVLMSDGTERSVCRFNGYQDNKETYEFNKSCQSGFECLYDEVCNSFYGKCIKNQDNDDNIDNDDVFDKIRSLPPLSIKILSESELKRKVASYNKELNQINEEGSTHGYGDIIDKMNIIENRLEELENLTKRYELIHLIEKRITDTKHPPKRILNAEDDDYLEKEDIVKADIPTLNYYLGVIYLKDGTQSLNKAFKYLKTAAESGQKDAQFMLGLMYIHGQGTAVNYNIGFCYLNNVFKPETNKSLSSSTYMGTLMELAKCYKFGIGTPIHLDQYDEMQRMLIDNSISTSDVNRFYEETGLSRFSDYEIPNTFDDYGDM